MASPKRSKTDSSAKIRSDVSRSAPKLEPPSDFQILGADKHQLSESVAMYLRERIVSGKLRTGQFLRIDAIAKELQVSTTPVREGLLLLQSESFVQLIPRRGFVVNGFTKGDLRDLFWAQATVGAELAVRAATRLSSEEFAQLQELHDAHEHAVAAGDEKAAASLGHQFHRTINLAAKSPRLALLLGSLTKQLPNRFYARIEGQMENSVKYHPMILDALRIRDEAVVRSLMNLHILAGADHLIVALERQGMWDEPKGQTERVRDQRTRTAQR